MRGVFDSIPRSWARAALIDRRWAVSLLALVAVTSVGGYAAYREYQSRATTVTMGYSVGMSSGGWHIICSPHPCEDGAGRIGEWFEPRADFRTTQQQWFTGKGGPYYAHDLMGRRL